MELIAKILLLYILVSWVWDEEDRLFFWAKLILSLGVFGVLL